MNRMAEKGGAERFPGMEQKTRGEKSAGEKKQQAGFDQARLAEFQRVRDEAEQRKGVESAMGPLANAESYTDFVNASVGVKELISGMTEGELQALGAKLDSFPNQEGRFSEGVWQAFSELKQAIEGPGEEDTIDVPAVDRVIDTQLSKPVPDAYQAPLSRKSGPVASAKKWLKRLFG